MAEAMFLGARGELRSLQSYIDQLRGVKVSVEELAQAISASAGGEAVTWEEFRAKGRGD